MLNFPLENLRNKPRFNVWLAPYFFVLAVIFSATFGLLSLDSFRAWKSDISVLIIPKNESASFQAEQILENLADITHRLSFYDRLLFDNSEIQDPFAGLTKDQRKAKWNESFSIERLPNSTTLNISVFNADKDEASKIASQIAQTLSGVASRFYNIQTELEFRIIEGPIASPYVRSWPWLLAGSLLAGIVLAFIVSFIFSQFGRKVRRQFKTQLDWSKIQPAKEMPVSRKDFFPPLSAGSNLVTKKASAPSNLPIAEIQEEKESPVEIFPSLEEKAPIEKREPTDEEYRERLNKLLRGEI